MSNTLTKLFKEVYTLIPGYTVRRWNPPTSHTVYTYYTTTVQDPIPRVIPFGVNVQYNPGDIVLTGYWKYNTATGSDEFIYYRTDKATLVYEVRTVNHVDSYVVTNPGYYSDDIVPDTYALSYAPNLGWNAAAISVPPLVGNGKASFSIPIGTSGIVCGLNPVPTSSGVDYFEIPHAIYFTKGNFLVSEHGALKTSATAYVSSDVFSLTRIGQNIYYAKNDVVFYASTLPSSGTLVMDSSIYSGGDTIVDASIVNTTTTTPYGKIDVTLSGLGVFAATAARAEIIASLNSMTASATSPSVTGISGILLSLTALGSSGYEYYNEINVSLNSLTASGYTGWFAPDPPVYIACAFMPMVCDAGGTTGGNTLPSVMYMPSMDVLATSHAGAGSAHTYADIIVSLNSMTAVSGNLAPPGSYGVIGFPVFEITAHGYETKLNTATINFTDFTISSYAGANANIDFVTLSAYGTGSHVDSGSATINFVSFTLSGTGTGYGNSSSSIGFISSTITAYGGGFGEIAIPSFAIAAIGSGSETGHATIDFVSWSISGTGTFAETASASIVFSAFQSSVVYANIPFVSFAANGVGSTAINNTVAYVLNIATEESTRYTNYDFMHIITIGGKHYGVKSDGLYLLEGDTDNGSAINGSITTKDSDHGAYASKRMAYVYMNSDSSTTITPFVDGVEKPKHASSFGGRKTKMARGNKGRYWQLKIENIVTLQGMEILPEATQRRVK